MVFSRMRENRRYKSEKASYDRSLASWEGETAVWKEETEHVENLLYMASHLDEVYETVAEAGFSVRLNKDEHILLALQGAGLVEPRSSGGSYQGGSQGVSFRVAKGVRYRVGQHKGTYVPGPEVQKVIDEGGTAYITTHRVLYSSPSRNREWAHGKTVDVFHSDTLAPGFGATYIGVTNRQKTSGFGYPMSHARTMRDRLLLAYAIHDGTVEDLITAFKGQKVELDGTRPVAPIPPIPPSTS